MDERALDVGVQLMGHALVQVFRSICHNYQKCTKALEHWAKFKSAEAPDRHREYAALLQELEHEIIESLEY